MPTEKFVRERLFDPLGIRSYRWSESPDGIPPGLSTPVPEAPAESIQMLNFFHFIRYKL